MTNSKLNWFYRISIWISVILIFAHILVKTVIWTQAKKAPSEALFPIYISQGTSRLWKYTTEVQKKLFNQANSLLAPAFTLLFAAITVKLIKLPDIFQEE